MVDISLDRATIELLAGLIGKHFASFASDPFIFTPSVFGIVGFQIDNRTFKLTSNLEAVQRFYHVDDIAVMKFTECTSKEIVSRMDDGQMISTPIEDRIINISVINDHEAVIHGNKKETLCSTKGIIFHLAGGNEVSFEIGTWFSEMITIRRGYELINNFTPLEDFYEEWDGCDGYVPECSREIISLK